MNPFRRRIGAQNQPPATEPIVNPAEGEGKSNQEFMTQILGMVEKVMSDNQAITQQLQLMQQQRAQAPESIFDEGNLQPGTQEKKFSELSPEEVDELTPQDMHRMMMDEMNGVLEAKLGESLTPLKKEFETFSQKQTSDSQLSEVNRVMLERDAEGRLLRPDFGEWVEELKALRQRWGKEAPLEDLYKFARMQYPEKAHTLDQKHFPQRMAEQPGGNAPSDFGGIPPNLMENTADGGDLSVKAAARQVAGKMRETQGALPSALTIPNMDTQQ